MFYAHFVLAKKGPMARIWLAAHWDKKLTKAHVYETNIEKSVEGILQPKVKMALRTTGHLLLGIVRIYSRKAKYLLADCNEAFVKIKMAFRPGMVDLPEESREAAVNAITLPEVFHDFDTVMPPLHDLSIQAQLSISQVMRVDEITLREEYGTIAMDFDNGFGEMPGIVQEEAEEEMSVLRDSMASMEQLREGSLIINDETSSNRRNTRSTRSKFLQESSLQPLEDLGADPGSIGGGLFNDLGDINQSHLPNCHNRILSQTPHLEETDPIGQNNFDPTSPGGGLSDLGGDFSRPTSPFDDGMPAPVLEETPQAIAGPSGITVSGSVMSMGNFSEHTTLLHNEEESFALEPVDVSAVRGQVRPKRKRKLIVDEIKAISGDDMKSQLSDTYDILMSLDLAPPTKKLMIMKEVGATEKLFAFPGKPVQASSLLQHYQVSSLLPALEGDEMFGLLGDSERDGLILEHVPGNDPDTPSKRGRKRKMPEDEPKGTKQANKRHLPMADKENMPLPFATPAHMATPAYPGTPGIPAYSMPGSSGQLATPAHMATPEHMGSPAYMPTPGNMGTPGYMATPGHMGSADINGFDDNYDMGAAWDDTPIQDDGPITPAQQQTPLRNLTESLATLDILEEPPSLDNEEMLDGETVEAFEERILNKRAGHLNNLLKLSLSQNDQLTFSKMVSKNKRKQVAQKFYSILVLQKALAVNVQQEGDNGDIFVSRGPRFETAVF